MAEYKEQGKLVFGLDIGTRSIVGIVGYREGDVFTVLAQESKEHETRAMLDGQIHDVSQVGNTIAQVRHQLEKKLETKLTDVCIAAAGRVLETVGVSVTWDLDQEKVITNEEIAGLTTLGIEKAYAKFQEKNTSDLHFYCVGNSVVRYYLNGYVMGNLENHKAHSIGCDMIATFLPDDVVDGLYRAVELAGLRVVNMTLEPIAAISVAIPEMYRMLNIGLVDVGAGTSDICITKDGCIVAYGMIPCAGDSLTEVIARGCLVDFNTAESIKRGIEDKDAVEYKDIMGLPQKIEKKAVLEMVDEQLEEMTKQVADRFIELNGGKPVSAVFVVGGGGRIEGYTKKLSEHLGIVAERVAVRGEDVMQKIRFKEEDARRDSMVVTPIGICLNYYEQSNNFIYVSFNEERIKIYDNGNLAVVDAAMNANFPNEGLFPKRGKAINYVINGRRAMKRGQLGEAARITIGGAEADMHSPIRANDVIVVEESTAGEDAKLVISELPEFKSVIRVEVNGSTILLPKFAYVNGEIRTQFYEVQDGDEIEMRDYYTVREVREFMDVLLDPSMTVYVNNAPADEDTRVYENFSIRWGLEPEKARRGGAEEGAGGSVSGEGLSAGKVSGEETSGAEVTDAYGPDEDADGTEEETKTSSDEEKDGVSALSFEDLPEDDGTYVPSEKKEEEPQEAVPEEKPSVPPQTILVDVNGERVRLSGKSSYVFVDVFDYIDFDLQQVRGSNLLLLINGEKAEYMKPVHSGDRIEIRWEK